MTLLNDIQTPCWLFDPDIVEKNYLRFRRVFDYATVAFAVKSNPTPLILERLCGLDAHFCIVSLHHLEQVLDLGAPPENIIFSHPIRSPETVQFALEAGVRCFCCDSVTEIDKIGDFGIHADIFVRVDVPSEGSMVPLSGKFGVPPDRVPELLRHVSHRKMNPIGLTFHVGSQCGRADTWQEAIRILGPVWNAARDEFGIDFLNIGGGFPVPYMDVPQLPDLEDLSANIRQMLQSYLPGAKRVHIEPGRAIAATAGCLLTTVIGTALRADGKTWVYLDAGIFNGLFETIDNIRYPFQLIGNTSEYTDDTEQTEYMLAGPSCDSLDKLFPIRSGPISVGDRILFRHTGAYGYTLETIFNGFDIPGVEIVPLAEIVK